MGFGVLDEDVVVASLLAVDEVEAVGRKLAAFALHADDDVVAHVAASEGDGAHAQAGVALHDDAGLGEGFGWSVEILQAVQLEAGALLDVDLQQLGGRAAAGLAVHLLSKPGIVGDDHAQGGAVSHRQLLCDGVGGQLPAVAPDIGQLVFAYHSPSSFLIQS